MLPVGTQFVVFVFEDLIVRKVLNSVVLCPSADHQYHLPAPQQRNLNYLKSYSVS